MQTAKVFNWGTSVSVVKTVDRLPNKQSLEELVELLAAEIKAYPVNKGIEAIALQRKLRPFTQAVDAKVAPLLNNRIALFEPGEIIATACKVRKTTFEEVLRTAGSRKGELKNTRQLIMYFLAKYTLVPLVNIGIMLQGTKKEPFDHTTVMHSRDLINDDLKTGCGLANWAAIIDAALMAPEIEEVF